MVSGGADLTVKLLDPSTLTVTKSFIVDSVPRSVDLQTYLLVGLRSGTILEFDVDKNAKETIMQAHHDGESWGLCVIEDQGKYFTSGDDNKVLMYDIETRKVIQKGEVRVLDEEGKDPLAGKVKKLVGGASTTSKEPPERQSRALAYDSTLKHLAVSDNKGDVTIRQVSFDKGSNLNVIIQTLTNPTEWVEEMAYNPQSNMLAVGSHDNFIYVYKIVNEKYMPYCKLVGHSSFITGLDWSLSDSPAYIRSTCGAYELLFFNVDMKK